MFVLLIEKLQEIINPGSILELDSLVIDENEIIDLYDVNSVGYERTEKAEKLTKNELLVEELYTKRLENNRTHKRVKKNVYVNRQKKEIKEGS